MMHGANGVFSISTSDPGQSISLKDTIRQHSYLSMSACHFLLCDRSAAVGNQPNCFTCQVIPGQVAQYRRLP